MDDCIGVALWISGYEVKRSSDGLREEVDEGDVHTSSGLFLRIRSGQRQGGRVRP